MVFYFLAVKAVVHVNAELVVQRRAGGNRQRDPLVSRTEQCLGLQPVLHNALRVELAQLCKLCAGLVVPGVDEIWREPAAFQREFAEFQHAAVHHEFDKALFVGHLNVPSVKYAAGHTISFFYIISHYNNICKYLTKK